MTSASAGFFYESPIEIPLQIQNDDRFEAWFLPDSEEDDEVILQACQQDENYALIARALIGDREYILFIEEKEENFRRYYHATSRVIGFTDD